MSKNLILDIKDVSVSFDGFLAINKFSFQLEKTGLNFLIGPNGAGKTTLLDVICGKTRVNEGKVIFKGKYNLSELKEYQITKKGVGRKFQAPSIFENLTVRENLVISLNQPKTLFSVLKGELSQKEEGYLAEILELIGLEAEADTLAGDLAHGQKQWLEIGMVMMQEPDLVLLDEPTAGMNKLEKKATGNILSRIAKYRSVLVVEHDMDFVRDYAHAVTVMHEGQLLCQGSVEEVQADKRVREVYLGEGGDGDAATRTA
jgi:urea transport system ATP-binding protein